MSHSVLVMMQSVCIASFGFYSDIREVVPPGDDSSSQLIYIIVGVTVFIVLVVSMLIVLAVKARWRVVCRKRRVPPSHPDDRNYPRGYMQVRKRKTLQ